MDNLNELLTALRALVAQLKADRISVTDELWTAEDVASYLKLATDTVERRVVTRPDFPAPLQPCMTGKKAAKRWFADEVISWARESRTKLPKGRGGKKGGVQ